MMKPIYIFLILIMVANQSKATSQIRDVLFFGMDTLNFYDSPLDKIEGISDKILRLRKDEYVVSSDCWKGFRAEWRIINGVLYLSNVFDCHSEKQLNPLIEEILGIKFTDGLIRADFVDGDYWAGKNQVYEQSFYTPIYKQEIKFAIKEGRVVNSTKTESFECDYSDKEDLKNFILKNFNPNEIEDLKGESIKVSVNVKSDKTGRIREVKIEDSTHSETNVIFKEAVMKLPCRPVYFNRGEFWYNEESIYLSVKTRELNEYVR
ncbi:hypothetical protein [Mongoliitalea daihaiensis]|uniref:hypothetical protein n=1 Tax=Mongoliitalea daihaiensis TaxID=2782006 RepID=UPI001F1C0355|nr:hypothetical protein [Mongoliitalea daihaiensis]UJP64736.1 hypothetical protein IPZ59_18385 [Mongoliitalea daihaiensis]UJP64750.1 hypothetical protein IPZ59_18465 [Mongoliitalea daihaiensis]